MVEMQEGYFVDNQGNVYSNRKFTKLTLIKQHKDAYGYLRVKLQIGRASCRERV